MITDYKIVQQREVDGQITFQKIRYYEGDVTTEDDYDPDTLGTKSVTRYRRTGMYEEVEYTYGN